MEISDLGGLSRPLTRLIEVVSKGIGRVTGPYLIRKNSEARALEIRTIASAIGDVARAQSLSITYKEGAIEMVPMADSLSLDSSPLSRRAETRLEHQEQKRQLNIESITSNAAVELMNDVDVPTDSPDDDWVTRFFESAQEVSSEKMQGLWSRILAGEIRRPGAFSLRTLEFVRNLSCEEAKLLERVGEIAIRVQDTCFIDVHDKEWIEAKYGIRAGHHFSLGELNILYPTDLALHFFQDSESKLVFTRGDTILTVEKGNASQACILPVWKFTSVGQELLTLVSTRDDEPLLEHLGRFFVKSGASANIGVIIERTTDKTIKCRMHPPLTI